MWLCGNATTLKDTRMALKATILTLSDNIIELEDTIFVVKGRRRKFKDTKQQENTQ